MKIALGAVQFGLPYGVSNKLGKVGDSEVKEILQYALKKGIKTLDTAPLYGNSEEIIGNFIHDNNGKCFDIVTKTPHFKSGCIDNKQINKFIETFNLSQKILGQESIYGLLVHNCDDLFLPGGEKLFKVMTELKESGAVKKIGVSVYDSEQIDIVLDNYPVDLVQLPVSIIDQRLVKSGHLDKLKKLGVEIHARSIFLQGLLLMPLNSIHPWFNPIQETLKMIHKEAEKQNISVLQLAMDFVNSIDEIDKIVTGVNSLEQLSEIINISPSFIDKNKLHNLSINDPIFLNPSNWEAGVYSK